jgi:hypothetical protein
MTPNRCIYYTSWLSLFSSMYGFHRGYCDLAFLQLLTFLASVNYWRDPDFGVRRWVDIGAVVTTSGYHIIRAYDMQRGTEFYSLLACSLICYAFSWQYQFRGNLWIAAYFHNGVHIFVCFQALRCILLLLLLLLLLLRKSHTLRQMLHSIYTP